MQFKGAGRERSEKRRIDVLLQEGICLMSGPLSSRAAPKLLKSQIIIGTPITYTVFFFLAIFLKSNFKGPKIDKLVFDDPIRVPFNVLNIFTGTGDPNVIYYVPPPKKPTVSRRFWRTLF